MRRTPSGRHRGLIALTLAALALAVTAAFPRRAAAPDVTASDVRQASNC